VLVRPVGYSSPWEKFENDVYEAVKRYFADFRPDFRVEWNYHVQDIDPDVIIIGDCECRAKSEGDFCEIPMLVFEASHMFEFKGEKWKEKDKQMKKYSGVCPAVLVTPRGYANRAYCTSAGDEYHIISF
jgi:hypothetical protein